MEEDKLMSQFEKIIAVWQKHQHNRNPKPFVWETHDSHVLALSKARPNNLNARHVLTPVDLANSSYFDPDDYLGPRIKRLAISNHDTNGAQMVRGSSPAS